MNSPLALSLFEIAQGVIAAGIELSTTGKTNLERLQAKFDTVNTRLGGRNIEEHATRNAVTVALTLIKQTSLRMCETSLTMDDLGIIKTFEVSLSKSLNDWLASRQR